MTIKPRTIFLTTFGAVLALTGALLMDVSNLPTVAVVATVLGVLIFLVGIASHLE